MQLGNVFIVQYGKILKTQSSHLVTLLLFHSYDYPKLIISLNSPFN